MALERTFRQVRRAPHISAGESGSGSSLEEEAEQEPASSSSGAAVNNKPSPASSKKKRCRKRLLALVVGSLSLGAVSTVLVLAYARISPLQDRSSTQQPIVAKLVDPSQLQEGNRNINKIGHLYASEAELLNADNGNELDGAREQRNLSQRLEDAEEANKQSEATQTHSKSHTKTTKSTSKLNGKFCSTASERAS